MSSLNPNAALYIPLKKQESKDENEVSELKTEDFLKNSYGTTRSSCPPEAHSAIDQRYPRADAGYDIHGCKDPVTGNDISRKHNIKEDPEMDLSYLAITFPNMSEQSLADVYSLNGGDLEASVDMLVELEDQVICPADSYEHLPDSLGIGDVSDVSECRVTEGSSTKLTSVVSGEARGSAAGPSIPQNCIGKRK